MTTTPEKAINYSLAIKILFSPDAKGEYNELSEKANYSLTRSALKLSKASKELEDHKKSLLELHAIKDMSGDFVVVDGRYVFKTPQSEASFISSYKEIADNEIDIDITPVDFNEVSKVKQRDVVLVLIEAGVVSEPE